MIACGSRTSRQRLGRGQADRRARLPLTLGQGVDTGADQLGDHAGVVERQSHDDAEQRETLAGDLQAEQAEVVGEEHHHQHRHGAEELHEDAADDADRCSSRQPAHAEQDAEDDRQHDAETRRRSSVPSGPASGRPSRSPDRGTGTTSAAVS